MPLSISYAAFRITVAILATSYTIEAEMVTSTATIISKVMLPTKTAAIISHQWYLSWDALQ
jgi:hypothetical protein